MCLRAQIRVRPRQLHPDSARSRRCEAVVGVDVHLEREVFGPTSKHREGTGRTTPSSRRSELANARLVPALGALGPVEHAAGMVERLGQASTLPALLLEADAFVRDVDLAPCGRSNDAPPAQIRRALLRCQLDVSRPDAHGRYRYAEVPLRSVRSGTPSIRICRACRAHWRPGRDVGCANIRSYNYWSVGRNRPLDAERLDWPSGPRGLTVSTRPFQGLGDGVRLPPGLSRACTQRSTSARSPCRRSG